MPAALWKGALAFGLVNIPVELRPAVRSAEKLSFRQLEKSTLEPIKMERVSSVNGEPVAWDDVVKGYEITKGKFVVVTDEDFASVAPEMSRVLEMTDFVPAESIYPRYFESPFFLVPQKGGEKAYALLRDALAETRKVGIGTFALRQKQHLAAVRAMGDALVLEMMRFEAELVDPADMAFPKSDDAKVRPQERQMAIQLIENLAEEFDASKYHDVYQEKLREIVMAKAKGKKVKGEVAPEVESTGVLDLMSRLQESLAKTGGGKRPKKSAKKERAAGPKRRRSA
jgi:DNA end-binding protein Ku